MSITPQMVKSLRESTGAGMGDCKKALEHSQGDLDKAVIYLREKGLAAAAKKVSRATSEGVIVAGLSPDSSIGYMIEINCETDFVTRNLEFQQLVEAIQKQVILKDPKTLDEVHALSILGTTVKEAVIQTVAKIGENLQVRRYARLQTPNSFFTTYIHGGGKIGVLVGLQSTTIRQAQTQSIIQECGRDIALQVAAMKPTYLSRDEVSPEMIESEKSVFLTQYRNQGKPEAALPKIVAGRVETWFKESCLLEQAFVKEDKKNVKQYTLDAGKKISVPDLSVSSFIRWELGEGVEKVTVDFATEVAQQIAQTQG